MKFFAYGLNHVTAPISVREKYALPAEKVMEVLGQLKRHASEAVFLSTCNRVEFYLSSERSQDCLEEIRAQLSQFHRLKTPEMKKYFYLYEGTEAYLHLFRVASSLDSVVVGEAQILGQVKDAFQESRGAGLVGSTFHGIFSRAFSAAKKVRTQTEIARMPVNVSSVAVDLARKIFSNLSEHSALLLGAGEMGELTAKYLVDAGVREFFIANRTVEKAQALATKLGGRALALDHSHEKMAEVDILLVSLGGTTPWLERGQLETVMKHRKGRAFFIIDIGVPRNVDPDSSRIESVYLYNIDDLSAIAEGNRVERQKAVESAEAILRYEVDRLCDWLNSLDLVPTVVRLRKHFEDVRQRELKEFFERNGDLSEKERKVLERLTHDLIGKLLHDPTVNLKKIPNEMDRFEYARMLNDIFLKKNGSKDE